MSLDQELLTFIEAKLAPSFPPTNIERMADELEAIVPDFNREKFVARAIAAWERNNLPIDLDDEIPY